VLKERVGELLGHLAHVAGVLQFRLQVGDTGVFLVELLAEFLDPVLCLLFLLADIGEFRDQVVTDGLEFGALEVVEAGRRARVEGLLAVELDARRMDSDQSVIRNASPSLEVLDGVGVL